MSEIAFFSGSGLSSLDFRVFQRHTQFETGDGPVAKALGCDDSLVQRVWRDNGLKPHRIKHFKVSHAPQFAEKLVDIVG